jgi:SAM-dependent methyltransferase
MPHHEDAAQMWGLGGPAYDNISFGVSDALAHAAQRLNAQPGEDILDVATGTGWSARNVARAGARVTAVDISAELLAAARNLSGHIRLPITFMQADTESLPFDDASFDGIISTFGVMFAAHHEQAARELARVCRPGGRLALAVWTPEGSVQQFLGIIGKHSPAPPPSPSPLAWGEPDHARDLLGQDFDLTFEPAVNDHYLPDTEAAWNWYAKGFGPMKKVIEALPRDRLAAFKDAIDAYHAKFRTQAGLHIRREYLLILGRRK